MKMGFDFEFKVPKVFKSVKFTLAAVNGIFLITGLLLLIVGIVALVNFSEYDVLITQRFFTIPAFVVATGVIILLGSVLGFYGAISKQFIILAGYAGLLLVVLIFELSIVIVSYGLRNNAASEIRSPMQQSLQLYDTRRDIAKIWDDLQIGFECCGVAGRFDFPTNRIPVSCCHIDYGTISPFECGAGNAHTTGCASVLGEWLSYNAYVIVICALIVLCLQTLLTAMAGWLAWRSKYEEIELES